MPVQQGIVHLVGAGPGDPGLITVKGLAALQRAQVVVYDHLVNPALLEHCAPSAKRVYVGKEQAKHTKPQAAMNRLLIRHAKAGKVVVRLKGGDPVLFGRGGEEALALAQAEVPYEIIPGVTSAVAVPAYAGIPVTHRGLSSSVAIVTGHEDPQKRTPAVDWKKVATATDTLVCLMGVGTLTSMAAGLIRAGRSKQTPCAAIEWGTLPQQRTITGTLATIARRSQQAGLKPPAVIVVGHVVRLRRWLAWFEHQPLFGKRIVITRPTDRADALAELLMALGADVEKLPAIALRPVQANGSFPHALKALPRIDWVFFTSPEGIAWFSRLAAAHGKDLRVLQGRHIGAIGPKTAAAIEAHGIRVDFIPRSFSQEGMLAGFTTRRLNGQRALIFSAQKGRDVLAQGLSDLGMRVERVTLYRTVMPPTLVQRLGEVLRTPTDLVTVTSSSCVEHLAQACAKTHRVRAFRRLRFASIGPVTSEAIRRYHGHITIEAKRSTIEGLVEAIVERIGQRACPPRWASGRRGGTRRGIP